MKLSIKKIKGNLQEQGFNKKRYNAFIDAIERRKTAVADWLGKKTEGYSAAQKRTGLIIFCIVFSVMFMLLLRNSINGHHFNYRTIVLSHPRSGVHDPSAFPLVDSVFRRVQRTREWLDSLKRYDTLKFKAIILSKPNLLDNLQLLEQLYQIQSK